MSKESTHTEELMVGEAQTGCWEENLRKHAEQMRLICAVGDALTEDHPDKFSVYIRKEEDWSSLTVVTEFEVGAGKGTKQLRLSMGLERRCDGRQDRLDIRPIAKRERQDGRFSYTLINVISSDNGVHEVLLAWTGGCMFEKGENTLRTKGALWILQNAKNLRRPERFGRPQGISLQDFRGLLKQQTEIPSCPALL